MTPPPIVAPSTAPNSMTADANFDYFFTFLVFGLPILIAMAFLISYLEPKLKKHEDAHPKFVKLLRMIKIAIFTLWGYLVLSGIGAAIFGPPARGWNWIMLFYAPVLVAIMYISCRLLKLLPVNFWKQLFDWLKIAAIAGSILLIIAGPFVFIIEIFRWLKFGNWPSWSFVEALTFVGLSAPKTSWVGIDKIIGFFLNLPAFFGISIVGLICLTAVNWLFNQLSETETAN